MAQLSPALSQLAELYGIETSYFGLHGNKYEAKPEVLLAVLKSLGAPVEKESDLDAALQHIAQEKNQTIIEPVIVLWQDQPASFQVRVPEKFQAQNISYTLHLESGEEKSFTLALAANSDRTQQIQIPCTLPLGYHVLAMEFASTHVQSTLIVAPSKAFLPQWSQKKWGIFAPLYALHSAKSMGAGDFTELKRLMDWTKNHGGNWVGILPILAAWLKNAETPSPYSPVSRLFWNEFYLDLEKIPEFTKCPNARRLLSSSETQQTFRALQDSNYVDFPKVAEIKRKLIQEFMRCFFYGNSASQQLFTRYIEEHPQLTDYARFQAITERQKKPWREWNSALQSGLSQPGEYSERVVRYHQFVQWLTEMQIKDLANHAAQKDMMFYLDFPLGVDPKGYDAWRYQYLFTPKTLVGAPPDFFFPEGQDWGFAPMHPLKAREQGYHYFIASIRHLLRFAKILRIDHVMSLHRLFWIPDGASAQDGVYVRNRSDELYAILCLESYRHQSILVGEDIGTVPPEVHPSMERHGLQKTFIGQFDFNPANPEHSPRIPEDCMAMLNTHDMLPFAGFWGNRGEPQAALRQYLSYIGRSAAKMVTVSLEDLMLEQEPQNVPGTTTEKKNWMRKTKFSFEQYNEQKELSETLQIVDSLRKS